MAVFGNPTLDEIDKDGKVLVVPGGSAFYVSTTMAFLGANIDVVGNIGNDYPVRAVKWLKRHSVGVEFLQRVQEPTTRFRLKYRGAHRALRVLEPGRRVIGVPSRRWDAVHVGPVFGEIDDSLMMRFRRESKFVSLDVQGLLRHATDNGVVRIRRRNLGRVLSSCDAVKASLEEAEVQTGSHHPVDAARRLVAHGPAHAIVTHASKGAVLAVRDVGLFEVAAYPEPAAVDPTGAGDGFVGAWLTTKLSTKDSVWAACVGSAFASLMLRHRGVKKFRFSRAELARRSRWVFRKVKRVT